MNSSAVVNDVEPFFARHAGVRAVFFNGRTARGLRDRRVEGSQALPTGLVLATLPSTSPANAALTLAQKTAAWRQVVATAAGDPP
ncbi:MAG: hypothetical protein BWY94_01754 [Actinobacteria bacterium ADurb.BinA094]|nr:MAG: hypothetical protein BWY94_01754 [Actinobacteria bacterium ADurb.BinA094]